MKTWLDPLIPLCNDAVSAFTMFGNSASTACFSCGFIVADTRTVATGVPRLRSGRTTEYTSCPKPPSKIVSASSRTKYCTSEMARDPSVICLTTCCGVDTRMSMGDASARFCWLGLHTKTRFRAADMSVVDLLLVPGCICIVRTYVYSFLCNLVQCLLACRRSNFQTEA